MAEEFHIGVGGPLYRLERATHLDKLSRLVPVLLAVTWAPLVVLALARWIFAHEVEPLVLDLSVHARLLLAVPLLLVGERILDRSGSETMARLFDEGFLPPPSAAKVHALLRTVSAWRDSRLPEAILLTLAIGLGVAEIAGLLPPAGLIHAANESRRGPLSLWYGLVSLPTFQFLLARSIFRWLLWVRLLSGLSRVGMRLLPAHADQRGGIAFLRHPGLAYGITLQLTLGSVLCASWGTQLIRFGAKLSSFKTLFAAFVIVGAVIVLAPLVLFTPQLILARLTGLRQFGALVSDYTQRFQARWIDRSEHEQLLGTSDIQSFADLSTTYRENVEAMQVLLMRPRDAIALLIASAIPAIPLVLTDPSAREALKKLLKMVAG